ncbi:MAG: PA2779 family protein [Gemmatimonadota bacterium]
MTRARLALGAAFLLLSLPAAGLAQAQEHVVSVETLDAIVAAHDGTAETERAELRSFLQRPEVRQIADEAGIDVVTAETAVASLDAAEIRQLSGQLAQVDAALSGGDSIVISTTALIIALLVLIIILVA